MTILRITRKTDREIIDINLDRVDYALYHLDQNGSIESVKIFQAGDMNAPVHEFINPEVAKGIYGALRPGSSVEDRDLPWGNK